MNSYSFILYNKLFKFYLLSLNLLIYFIIPVNLEANNSNQDINPYIKANVAQSVGSDSKTGLEIDGFLPIVNTNKQLFFANIKLDGYSNEIFAGGFYLGYHYLQPTSQRLYGAYIGFDINKSVSDNYFNRVIIGLEHWFRQYFFGATIYTPIHNKIKNNGYFYEQVVPGVSAEIGYEFSKKASAFIEGYYFFYTSNAKKTPGVKFKLKQNLFNKNTKLDLLNKMDLEIGIRKDKHIGNLIFIGLSFNVGTPYSDSVPDGVAVHMADSIFRGSALFISETLPKPAADYKNTNENNTNKRCYSIESPCRYMYGEVEPAGGSSSYCPNLSSPSSKNDSRSPKFKTISDLTYLESRKAVWGWYVLFDKIICTGNKSL